MASSLWRARENHGGLTSHMVTTTTTDIHCVYLASLLPENKKSQYLGCGSLVGGIEYMQIPPSALCLRSINKFTLSPESNTHTHTDIHMWAHST